MFRHYSSDKCRISILNGIVALSYFVSFVVLSLQDELLIRICNIRRPILGLLNDVYKNAEYLPSKFFTYKLGKFKETFVCLCKLDFGQCGGAKRGMPQHVIMLKWSFFVTRNYKVKC